MHTAAAKPLPVKKPYRETSPKTFAVLCSIWVTALSALGLYGVSAGMWCKMFYTVPEIKAPVEAKPLPRKKSFEERWPKTCAMFWSILFIALATLALYTLWVPAMWCKMFFTAASLLAILCISSDFRWYVFLWVFWIVVGKVIAHL